MSMMFIFFPVKMGLIELIFRWPIIVFKALPILCLRISRMSLCIEKQDSAFSEEREP